MIWNIIFIMYQFQTYMILWTANQNINIPTQINAIDHRIIPTLKKQESSES